MLDSPPPRSVATASQLTSQDLSTLLCTTGCTVCFEPLQGVLWVPMRTRKGTTWPNLQREGLQGEQEGSKERPAGPAQLATQDQTCRWRFPLRNFFADADHVNFQGFSFQFSVSTSLTTNATSVSPGPSYLPSTAVSSHAHRLRWQKHTESLAEYLKNVASPILPPLVFIWARDVPYFSF